MVVEVWSDVVCPWCLIGKRRLERALEATPELDVELVFRSFELDPNQTPLPAGSDLADVLARKYGMSRDKALGMMSHVAAQAAEEGVTFDFDAQKRESGTFDAHRLLQLAVTLSPALQISLKDRLMRGWFCEGRSVRDLASLRSIAVESGLPEDQVDAVLADPSAFADAVRHDEAEARTLGISGVPYFVIDRHFGLSGAQPPALLARALREAAARKTPEVSDAPGCGPDDCAVS